MVVALLPLGIAPQMIRPDLQEIAQEEDEESRMVYYLI